MHQFFLGTIPKLIEYITLYLQTGKMGNPATVSKTMDSFFRTFPGYPQLKIFKGGILNLKNTKAFEYRDLLFQLPFMARVLNFPDMVTLLCVKLTEWFLLTRKKRFTVYFSFLCHSPPLPPQYSFLS